MTLVITRAGRRIRTDDLLITNQLLYQLSYAGNFARSVAQRSLRHKPRELRPTTRQSANLAPRWSGGGIRAPPRLAFSRKQNPKQQRQKSQLPMARCCDAELLPPQNQETPLLPTAYLTPPNKRGMLPKAEQTADVAWRRAQQFCFGRSALQAPVDMSLIQL